MVDRHGFAPCSPACEASDLLNDRAAQKNEFGNEKVARRLGALRQAQGLEQAKRVETAAPSPQGFGDQATQAGARRIVIVRLASASLTVVRSAGIAPASPDWHSGILLLDDDRE